MKITSTAKDMKGFICEVTDLTDEAEHWESDRDIIVEALHGASAKSLTMTLTGTAISVLLRKPKMDKFQGTLEEALAQYFTATVKDTKAIEAKAAEKAEKRSRLNHLRSIQSLLGKSDKAGKKTALTAFSIASEKALKEEIETLAAEIEPKEETVSKSIGEMVNYLSNLHPEKQPDYLKMSSTQLRELVEAETKNDETKNEA